jgi:hypothetical protein
LLQGQQWQAGLWGWLSWGQQLRVLLALSLELAGWQQGWWWAEPLLLE